MTNLGLVLDDEMSQSGKAATWLMCLVTKISDGELGIERDSDKEGDRRFASFASSCPPTYCHSYKWFPLSPKVGGEGVGWFSSAAAPTTQFPPFSYPFP